MPVATKTADLKNTSIRKRSLTRVAAVLPFLSQKESITDFISKACDRRTRPLVKKHNISLPPDAAFDAGYKNTKLQTKQA